MICIDKKPSFQLKKETAATLPHQGEKLKYSRPTVAKPHRRKVRQLFSPASKRVYPEWSGKLTSLYTIKELLTTPFLSLTAASQIFILQR
jgi:hypothetical protein